MGHRHRFSTSQMLETDDEQSWAPAEQPYMNLARAGTAENTSLAYPVEHIQTDGIHFSSHQNPQPSSSGYPSSSFNIEMPCYHSETSGPTHDPFLHSSASGSLCLPPKNFTYHESSSNYGGHAFNGIEGDCFDFTMANGRGPNKRKRPSVPAVCERGSSSRYHDAGSFSSQIGSSLSIGGASPVRNVRSRGTMNMETDPSATHLSGDPSTSRSTDHSRPIDMLAHDSNALGRERDHAIMSSAFQGRITMPDSSPFSRELSHFSVGGRNASASVGPGAYNNNFTASRRPAPQNLPAHSMQSVRGFRRSYSQRSLPTFRASSSNIRLGNVANSDEGQLVTESISTRSPRPSTGWSNFDWNGGRRLSSERNRYLSDEAAIRAQLTTEGLMIVDHSTLYGSRNFLDGNRGMRLDIDNMSYEELLELGERIGNVNTGLSEDQMSKCLTESIYCSSDQFHEEETCVICLEEYKNLDDVGILKACGHDFHVGCIRKWLSMKKLCPICKASAISDKAEEK